MATTTWTADRRLYLDKDGKVVEADDPTRARLLVPAGGTIPLVEAERLGLIGEKAKAAPAENKMRAAAPENKEIVPGVPAIDDAGETVKRGRR